jgi:hypothetical protein
MSTGFADRATRSDHARGGGGYLGIRVDGAKAQAFSARFDWRLTDGAKVAHNC